MDDGKRELKRCPICGSLPRYWQWNHGAIVECWCKDHRIQCEGKTLEEAVEAWERRADNDAHNEGYDVGYWAGRRDYEPRWIPVAERRPEAYGRYLVTLEYEGYRSVMPLYYGRINRIDTFYDSDSEYGDIEYCGAIAWMPLPTPYKGGEEE